MHFQLVDHVIERTADRITAVKAVTAAEEYLQDHFPGFPVLPGVLMLESLVQAGRLLVDQDSSDTPLVLVEVRNIRYGNMVKPGQSLHIEVTLRKQQDDGFDFEGVGKINDQVAVQGRFKLAPVPAAA
jgi:3-hydroxyacyl-[acyl-carrier-protein] dehydratase